MLSRFYQAAADAGVRPDTAYQRDEQGRTAYLVTVGSAEFRALPPVREGGTWLVAVTVVTDDLDIETVSVKSPETLAEVLDLCTAFATEHAHLA